MGCRFPARAASPSLEILNLIEGVRGQDRHKALPSLDNAKDLPGPGLLGGLRDGLCRPEPLRRRCSERRLPRHRPGQGWLTSDGFAAERACSLQPQPRPRARPIPLRQPRRLVLHRAPRGRRATGRTQTTVSRPPTWSPPTVGQLASYTLTIEQTGGSGITVPGFGFLLNSELPTSTSRRGHRQRPRPRPAGPEQAPAVVDEPDDPPQRRQPFLAVGSPGGATIITSVSQTILGYLDRDLPLVGASRRPG